MRGIVELAHECLPVYDRHRARTRTISEFGHPDSIGPYRIRSSDMPACLVPRVGWGPCRARWRSGRTARRKRPRIWPRCWPVAGCEVVELGPVDSPARATAAGRLLAEQHVHAAAFAAASWFEDYLVLDLLEECSLPVLLWALPGMETGALCGCQQLTAFLEQLGHAYRARVWAAGAGCCTRGEPGSTCAPRRCGPGSAGPASVCSATACRA